MLGFAAALVAAAGALGLWAFIVIRRRRAAAHTSEQHLAAELAELMARFKKAPGEVAVQPEQPALLDTIQVPVGKNVARIELRRGDLTALPEEETVDVLVVAWFPDATSIAYGPIDRPLFAALERKGISVLEARIQQVH